MNVPLSRFALEAQSPDQSGSHVRWLIESTYECYYPFLRKKTLQKTQCRKQQVNRERGSMCERKFQFAKVEYPITCAEKTYIGGYKFVH